MGNVGLTWNCSGGTNDFFYEYQSSAGDSGTERGVPRDWHMTLGHSVGGGVNI